MIRSDESVVKRARVLITARVEIETQALISGDNSGASAKVVFKATRGARSPSVVSNYSNY